MKTPSIKTKIKQRLESGQSITTWQAIQWWKYTRLAARIEELRDSGMNIQTEMLNKDGKRYAKYTLQP